MKLFLCLSFMMASVIAMAQQSSEETLYGTGEWNRDSLGNHRVVVAVDKTADAVLAKLDWRRRDKDVQKKRIIVVDATTGKKITNVCRFKFDREMAEIAFQPVTVPGEYYIYYLPNKNTAKQYYPQMVYLPYEETADASWIKKNKLSSKTAPRLPEARLVQYQAVDEFNSFYPMEIIATKAETESIIANNPKDNFLLFTEDRKFPIRMTEDLPYRWITDGNYNSFKGNADKGEYYCFQIGVWAARTDIENVNVTFSPMTCEKNGAVIPVSAFTCFNTGGVDVSGNVFEKDCSVPKGKVQALWVGTMIPEQAKPGVYRGKMSVSSKNAGDKTIDVEITVSDNLIANHGDNDTWRHSRLRWLNSQIGKDEEVIAPYKTIGQEGKTLSILGRTVKLSDTGLPSEIESYFTEAMTSIGDKARKILSSPMEFEADGGSFENLNFEITGRKPGLVSWKAVNQNKKFIMQLEGDIESDGNMTYKVILIAKEDASINDIKLKTRLTGGLTKYMMGLGEKGGYARSLDWKWEVKKNQDAIWTGDVNAGLQLRFYDDKYERPLNTNFYQQKPLHMPLSWCNNFKGGIRLDKSNDEIVAYSGQRDVKKGESLHYYFNILITPFRPIDTNKQWKNRFYHRYEFVDKVSSFGGNVINVHHATEINPYINYPYLRPKQMKAYADAAHAKDMTFKIYNTVRELSNHATELFALRSLNGEIFSKGNGGGYSWLQEHLDQDYIAAWFSSPVRCAAIINEGVSRWHNYYMEGLDWLVRNVGIDGLYIDDLAFDRESMKRVRKILDRANPNAMIDLHSCNQYNPSDGYANSANLYLEHFPYLDRLWFGEMFDYDNLPDFYLIELSGIPYGLMSEMLEGGGNKWRGMLYGMTARMPWSEGVDNRPIWKLWDEFSMKDSEMIGYWVSDNPVKTNKEKTLATIYRRYGKKTLISLATWEDCDAEINLDIDWNALGLDKDKVTLHAPEIDLFQTEHTWKPGETITVPKGKGLMIIAE